MSVLEEAISLALTSLRVIGAERVHCVVILRFVPSVDVSGSVQ